MIPLLGRLLGGVSGGLISKILGGASVALLLALGIQSARLSHAKGDLRHARGQVADLKQRATELTAAMLKQRSAAVAAVNALQATCQSERTAAVRTGRTIERVTHAPPPPAAGPRGLVTSDDLRAIVAEPEPDEAVPAKPVQ